MLEEKNCSLYRSQPLTILELQIVQPLGRQATWTRRYSCLFLGLPSDYPFRPVVEMPWMKYF